MKRGSLFYGAALACAGLLVAWNWTGCGDEPGSHEARTASRPAGATGPTTAEILAKDAPVLPANLASIPELGTTVAEKDAKTGELWQVYKNGLAYYDVTTGSGPVPQLGQLVKVQYVGTFPENGAEFDSSKPGQPFPFTLGEKGIIQGWNMAVSTMHVGTKRKIRIPPALAYEDRGSPPKIKPNQTLLFEITLLEVSGTAAATSSAPAKTLPSAVPFGPPMPASGTEPTTQRN